jgi:hypothetical protein
MDKVHFGKLIHGFDRCIPIQPGFGYGKGRGTAGLAVAERNEWVFCRQAG